MATKKTTKKSKPASRSVAKRKSRSLKDKILQSWLVRNKLVLFVTSVFVLSIVGFGITQARQDNVSEACWHIIFCGSKKKPAPKKSSSSSSSSKSTKPIHTNTSKTIIRKLGITKKSSSSKPKSSSSSKPKKPSVNIKFTKKKTSSKQQLTDFFKVPASSSSSSSKSKSKPKLINLLLPGVSNRSINKAVKQQQVKKATTAKNKATQAANKANSKYQSTINTATKDPVVKKYLAERAVLRALPSVSAQLAKPTTKLNATQTKQVEALDTASAAKLKADTSLRTAVKKLNQATNVANGLTAAGKVPALNASGCAERGRNFSGGKCQNSCKDGGKIVSSFHNFCSNSITPTISKHDCTAGLGRKWIAGAGCAHGGSSACTNGDEYHGGKGTAFDYCGNRQDYVSKVVPVARQDIQKPIPSNIQVSIATAISTSGITGGTNILKNILNSSATDCVSYVGDVLLRAGYDYGAILNGHHNKLNNGGGYVDSLVTKPGWAKTTQASPGAVVSFTRHSHVAIVTAVHPDGSVTVEHANWPRGSGPHPMTFSASEAKAYGFVYAVHR